MRPPCSRAYVGPDLTPRGAPPLSDLIDRLGEALSGRYEIVRQIGEGGMATVYLAEDLKHNRKVALKVLKPALAAIVGAERFLAEIETTAGLQHPNILPLYDSGEADGSVFFVMPYVEEETLRERLDRERQLPVDEAVRIAREVAEALDHAHRHGVIHRDIKPGNILLRDGRPLVADFGIALAASRSGSGERLTETGLSLGTPFYMSPEQATGSQEVGPTTDVYALGCVLYEMLVGEPPYVGSTPQAVLGKIITGEVKSVSSQRRSVPLNVDGAIAKAVEKLPADRFSTAKEFARALGDSGFRYGERAGASAGTGRTRAWAVVSSMLVVVFALVAGWALFRPDPPRPVTRFQFVQPQGVDITGGVNPVRGFAVSSDGRTVVFADGPTGQLYRYELDGLDAVPIPGGASAWYPFLSPDGEWVGFIDQSDNTLRKIRLDGSESQILAEVPGGARSAGWGPDGSIVVASSAWDELQRVRDTGGEPEPIANTGGGIVWWLDLLPDGRAVVASGARGQDIFTLSLETGERKTLFEGTTPRFVDSGHLLFWRRGALWGVPFDPERLEVKGQPVQIVPDVGADAGNAPDHFDVGGTTLFYREGPGAQQVPLWVGSDGAEEVLDPSLSGLFRAPAISPDGRRIAFVHARPGDDSADIWIYDLDQRNFSPLTFQDGNTDPFWSPDGSEVGFTSNRDNRVGLYARPVDLSREARLLYAESGTPREGVWTPDGSGVVFRRGGDILQSALDSEGSSVPVVATPADERTPALSPDGRWVAYASDESGQFEVYLRPFADSGGQIKISTDGAYSPVWVGEREIVYLTLDELGYPAFWALATIRTGPAPAVEARDSLFPVQGSYVLYVPRSQPSPDWDYSREDRRILVTGTPGDTSGVDGGRYVVVENFAELLRQIEPE